jgi:hypothetical protein
LAKPIEVLAYKKVLTKNSKGKRLAILELLIWVDGEKLRELKTVCHTFENLRRPLRFDSRQGISCK